MPEAGINAENSGSIKISDEVIMTIAAVAVSEVEGVSCTGGTLSELAQKFGKKSFAKGIKVTNEDEITIDINVAVNYGVKIPDVAWNVQDNVKKSVELMSGLTVGKVNVHVIDVVQNKTVTDEKDTASETDESQN